MIDQQRADSARCGLAVRAGFIRQLGSGIYDYLPLAKRTLTRIEAIGIPIRIAVGTRGLADGKLEWKLRRDGQVEMVALGEVAARVAALLGR